MTEEDEAFNEIERRSIAKKETVKAQLKSQEPVSDEIASIIACRDMLDAQPVPPRTWVGLTEEEILDLFDLNNVYGSKWIEFARTVEAKLKEKNNG